jgi:hypothetical protein
MLPCLDLNPLKLRLCERVLGPGKNVLGETGYINFYVIRARRAITSNEVIDGAAVRLSRAIAAGQLFSANLRGRAGPQFVSHNDWIHFSFITVLERVARRPHMPVIGTDLASVAAEEGHTVS